MKNINIKETESTILTFAPFSTRSLIVEYDFVIHAICNGVILVEVCALISADAFSKSLTPSYEKPAAQWRGVTPLL